MLTPHQLQQFHNDGFLIVKVFTPAELQPVMDAIAGLVEELAEKLKRHGKLSDTFADAGFYTRLTKLERACPGAAVWLHVRGKLPLALAELWSHPRLLDIVEQMIGPDIAGHPVWNIRAKTPINPLATVPWHQDTAYLIEGAEQTPQPTAWVPLIDTNPTNGTLQVIRGGHKIGRTVPHHPQRETGAAKSWYLYIQEADLPPGDVVTCDVPLGSVLFLNQLTPHRSTENVSDKIRWSVDLRWQRPGDPSGVTAAPCIPMRSGKDRSFRPDWSQLTAQTRRQDIARTSSSEELNLDITVDGPWLKRWTKSDA